MLKACLWKGEKLPCSQLFSTFPTDQGMCCTFNMKKADEMFKASQYQKMVQSLQTRDKENSFENNLRKELKWSGEPIPQVGRKKGLQLVLDAHSDQISGGTVPEDFDGFYAVIDSSDKYPTVDKASVLIRAGHNNFVAMGATKVSADEGIKDMEPSKRNCLFYDEMKLNFHQNYTRANCLLECAMDFAMTKVLSAK